MRFRIIQSSEPGAVERDRAIWLLIERAVLTRLVCRELAETTKRTGRRPVTALDLLLGWVNQHFSSFVHVEPHARDGLEAMAVPEGCEDLYQEIVAGTEVCEALFMAMTADSPNFQTRDLKRLDALLKHYLDAHGELATP
jgi:hypothetical protein